MKTKYFAINLTRNVQNLYEENIKIFLKGTKVVLDKWRVIFCPCKGRLSVINLLVLPKKMDKYKAMPIKIPKHFFLDPKQILKFVWKNKHVRLTGKT